MLVALAGVFAALPASAEVAAAGPFDDCTTNTNAGVICQEVAPPQLGSPVPNVPTHYLWIGPGKCTGLNIGQCAGTPAGEDSTVGVFGVLYEESNGGPGLQRKAIEFSGELYLPDRMVLI